MVSELRGDVVLDYRSCHVSETADREIAVEGFGQRPSYQVLQAAFDALNDQFRGDRRQRAHRHLADVGTGKAMTEHAYSVRFEGFGEGVEPRCRGVRQISKTRRHPRSMGRRSDSSLEGIAEQGKAWQSPGIDCVCWKVSWVAPAATRGSALVSKHGSTEASSVVAGGAAGPVSGGQTWLHGGELRGGRGKRGVRCLVSKRGSTEASSVAAGVSTTLTSRTPSSLRPRTWRTPRATRARPRPVVLRFRCRP